MDAVPQDTRDLPAKARERVGIGPVPDWVRPCDYDMEFKTAARGALTHLLIERQVDAELGQMYVRTAVRLETMQAVQHQSQWRLEFEPQTQSVLLHSIKIRRGPAEAEHASLDRLQFLQREAGLEGCVIDGWITLLLLLEDVCPGDVLEWSYTVTSRPLLLPEYIHLFLTLPAGEQIGKHHLLVRHSERRPLRWKSSSTDLAPVIERHGAEIHCSWWGEEISSPEPEAGAPPWKLQCPWIQISDCPDWQTVVRAVLNAWKEDAPGAGLTRLLEEIRNHSPDVLARVNRAIELVQDSFRYLSVNLELAGQIPAPAEAVIRRRYGDCKDLAFLLVQLLRGLGVPARPVLVHTVWRLLPGMLPSPGVFDHAVVEYEIDQQKRWVDATLKSQGGGALRRCVPDYGLGLPIDVTTLEPVPVPKTSLPAGAFEVKESFILDTAGNSSYLSVVVTARGVHADDLRSEFEGGGADVMARKRLQICAQRFGNATRISPLQHRDDRELNEFVLAEAFEIDGFLPLDGVPGSCLFFIRSDVTAGMLVCPPIGQRRTPITLPFPCNQVHTVDIDFAGVNFESLPLVQIGNGFFEFSRRSKALHKFFRLTFSLSTLAESVPPDRLPQYRKELEPVWRESALQIRLPLGYARMRKPDDFGALPPLSRPDPGAGRAREETRPAPVFTHAPSNRAQVVRSESQAPPIPETAGRTEKRVSPEPTRALAGDADRHPSSRGHRSRSRSHRRTHIGGSLCMPAFYILLAAAVVFAVGALLLHTPRGRPVAGLIFLLVTPAVTLSLILAILGLRQCAKNLATFSSRGMIAAVTILFCLLFELVLVPGFVLGVRAMIAGRAPAVDRSIPETATESGTVPK